MNTLCFVVLLCVGHFVATSKYSSDLNDGSSQYARVQFRLAKYNNIWKKALETVPEEKLGDLQKTLRKLDKTELELKHMRESEKPYDGELEASVRERLLEVLDDYGLATNEVYNHELHKKHSFDDTRLEKLWQKALQEGGYSADELGTLRSEFQHIQDKIVEYKELASIVGKHDGSSENEVEPDTSFERRSEKELKVLRKDLKEKYHSVKDKLYDAEQKMSDRLSDDSRTFTDKRVIELWDFAQKSGRFSKDELDNIMEELGHFQVRIHKHRHWQDQTDKLGKAVNSGEHHLKDEFEDVLTKEKEHARLVKKYHATMLDRVGHHNEL